MVPSLRYWNFIAVKDKTIETIFYPTSSLILAIVTCPPTTKANHRRIITLNNVDEFLGLITTDQCLTLNTAGECLTIVILFFSLINSPHQICHSLFLHMQLDSFLPYSAKPLKVMKALILTGICLIPSPLWTPFWKFSHFPIHRLLLPITLRNSPPVNFPLFSLWLKCCPISQG